MVRTFVDYDLFGFSSKPNWNLFQQEAAKEQAFKLANVMCCFHVGRNYFANHEKTFIGLAMDVLGKECSMSMLQNGLGVLEKMSLRPNTQKMMVESGIIQEIIYLLEDSESLSDGVIIYMCGILMNLFLKQSGRQCAFVNAEKLLAGLCELMEHEDLLVRAYVHGVCYSFLEDSEIRDKARSIGLPELLECVREGAPQPILSQIEYTFCKLNSDDAAPDQESEDYEEEIENEDGLDEFDEQELELQDDEVSGDELLVKYEAR